MKNPTKVLFLFFSTLFLSLFQSGTTTAQNTTIKNSFIIHGNDLKKDDVSFFTKSIEAADFEQFRLQTETVILKFKNGFTLELISAKELIVRNIKQNLEINKYTNYSATPNYKYPLFEILPSGWVTAGVEPTNTKN